MELLKDAKNNIFCGAATGVISLPTSIGLGVLIYGGLGNEYAAVGASIGIISAIILCFIVAIVGKIPTQISTPSSTSCFILSGLVVELTQVAANSGIHTAPVILIGYLGLIILTASILQLIFGLLNLGKVIKYIPYPVIAGFMNGVGLLFVINQWQLLLGLDRGTTYSLDTIINDVSLWSLAIGIITVLALFSAKEWKNRYPAMPPAPVIGILIGAATYYYLSYLGGYQLGPVLGEFTVSFASLFNFAHFLQTVSITEVTILAPFILKSGLTLAVVTSLSTMLRVLMIEVISHNREDGNRSLKSNGFANLISACFGGIVGTPSMTIMNLYMGASSRLSGIVCSITMLIFLIFFQNIIAGIPYVVVAGVLIYFGLKITDLSGLRLLWIALKNKRKLQILLVDQSLSLIVTISTLVLGVTTAVTVGTSLAIFMYFLRSSKSAVRKYYYGDVFHSKVRRTKQDRTKLYNKGKQILVCELQGSIFFGAADEITCQVEEKISDTDYFILDFKYAHTADITGIIAIQKLNNYMKQQGKSLLVSSLRYKGPIFATMNNLGIINEIGEEHFFLTTDKALEWAENRLLDNSDPTSNPVSWRENQLFKWFNELEINIINKYLIPEQYPAKTIIFNKDDTPTKIFIVTKGKVELLKALDKKTAIHRVSSIIPGYAFGIIGLFNHKKYQHYAKAHSDVEVYSLSIDDLNILEQQHPELMLKFLKSVTASLSLELYNSREDLYVYETQ